MRNGIVADTLRKSGCPYRLIYGVNLPQLTEIASMTEKSEKLAQELWDDMDLRESRLLAAMLFPIESITMEKARRMVDSFKWQEDADITCFKLFRNTNFASSLAHELCRSEKALDRYTGLRLWFNIVSKYPDEALRAAREELKRENPISGLASMLAEEAELIKDFRS